MKKPTKQQHLKHQKRHRSIVGLSIVVTALLVGLIFSLIILPKINHDARLHRLNEIYNTIKLPQNIYSETDNVFGDKRPSTPDESRSTASTKTFVIAKTVTQTYDEIDRAIQAAGNTLLGISNPGSVTKEGQYKTGRGEYIRLNVSSKLRNDAARNEALMTGSFSPDFIKIDPNAGPSTVTLKVNLDDNNE